MIERRTKVQSHARAVKIRTGRRLWKESEPISPENLVALVTAWKASVSSRNPSTFARVIR